MIINQVSVFAENRSGTALNVTNTLAEAGIDIRAMSIADAEDFGILRLIVSDTQKAKQALSTGNYVVTITPVIGIKISDVPGGLAAVLKIIAEHGINVEYLYAFIAVSGKSAYVVLRVNDNDKTVEVLNKAGIEMISQTDVDAL